MKKYNYILFFITLLHNAIMGQGFKRSFKLPFAYEHITKNVFETPTGSYVMFGICVDTLNGFLTNRLVVNGLNAQGHPQWTKKYGSSKFEYLNNSLISKWFYKQGNFVYHAGCVRDSNNKQLGVFIKFDLNGDTLWQKRFYDLNDYTIPQMCVQSVDNGFFITGIFEDPINPNRTVLLIKTDANGNELWRKKIPKNIPNAHDGKVIIQDSATRKIVIIGYQYVGSASAYTGYTSVLICDSLGNKLGQYNYGGYPGLLTDVVQTKDKKFVAVGSLTKGTLGNLDTTRSFAVKFDINNPLLPIWKLEYDKPDVTNFFTSITELNNQELLITGILDTVFQHNMPVNCLQRIVRVSKNGTVLYKKYFDYNQNPGADNNMAILSLNKTSDGGFVSAFQSFNLGIDPFFIVKYDSTFCDSTVAYCYSVGFNEHTLNNNLFSVYPNPTNGILYFNAAFDCTGCSTRFLNAIGQLVYECTAEPKINISSLPKGIYLMEVYKKQKLIATKKIIRE